MQHKPKIDFNYINAMVHIIKMETSNNDCSDPIESYLQSLSAIELKALEIAKTQLQSSFSVEKSIGYIEWVKKQEVNN